MLFYLFTFSNFLIIHIRANWALSGIRHEFAVVLYPAFVPNQLVAVSDNGVIYLATEEGDGTVTHEQRSLAPVGIETAIVENRILATTVRDQLVFTVVEEIAFLKVDVLGVIQFHDAISAVVNIGTGNRQHIGFVGHNAISAATIEVAGSDSIPSAARHSYDATVAIAAFGMTDGQVMDHTAHTVNQIQAERITGFHLDAGIVLATNDKILEVLQYKLLAVVDKLADDDGLIATTLDIRSPSSARDTGELVFLSENAREVQVNILIQLDDTVVAQGIEELLLSSDGNDTIDSLSHRRSCYGILVTYTVFVSLGLFALDELYVRHLDDAQMDAVIVGHRLVPRLRGEIILQVLRLELPAMTSQNLITHQTQLGF